MTRFSDFEDKNGRCLVWEDGSAGSLGNGTNPTYHRTYKALIPEGRGWNDWPEPKRAMRVTNMDDVRFVRAEICRRWLSLMRSMIENDI